MALETAPAHLPGLPYLPGLSLGSTVGSGTPSCPTLTIRWCSSPGFHPCSFTLGENLCFPPKWTQEIPRLGWPCDSSEPIAVAGGPQAGTGLAWVTRPALQLGWTVSLASQGDKELQPQMGKLDFREANNRQPQLCREHGCT